ncbi:carotenoid oxygenase [Mycena crocata]|nr:carotenoid oxygenase [Mycena crocata]
MSSTIITDASVGVARGFYNCPQTKEPVELEVVGKIPSWVNGILYRTGPGTFEIAPNNSKLPDVKIRHWFDGLTLNHRFEITDGKVLYRSRYAAEMLEDYFKTTGTYDHLPIGSFGQADPCESLFGHFFSKFKPRKNLPQGKSSVSIGVTITPHFNGFSTKDALVVKTDANMLQVLDRVTLEPIRIATYASVSPELDGPLSAAHAVDDEGNFYNYTLGFGAKPVYKVFKIDKTGNTTVLARITDAPAAYLHTIGATKKFVVLGIWQSDFKMGGLPILLTGAVSVNTFKPWSTTRPTFFYLIDRKDGTVSKYEADTFFAFHALNYFDDEDGSVVIDLACYKDNSILEQLTVDHLRTYSQNPTEPHLLSATPRRFRLPNPSTAAKGAKLRKATSEFTHAAADMEFPVVNPRFAWKPYRYAYGVHGHAEGFLNSVIKLDVTSGEFLLWEQPGSSPGEPIFVCDPYSEDEDAGVLLTVVLDGRKGVSALVVLDAKTMTEVGRATMAVPVQLGFHGVFDPTINTPKASL